jgi:dihydropteroate synthase
MSDRGAAFARLLSEWHSGAEVRPALLMGVVNVTPDSFADGGRFADRKVAVGHGLRLAGEGAAILDVGGESTRPGGAPVDAEEEKRRVLPVIQGLAQSPALISIDTIKPEVADAALSSGAHIVNDVRGLQGDPAIAQVTARHGAGLVVMHNPALFGSSQGIEGDPVEACLSFFRRSLELGDEAGVERDRIVLDPGIGFGKSVEQNCELIARLPELLVLGLPVAIGASRKSFLGRVTGRPVNERLHGTLAANTVAALMGAAILRVHDVAEHADCIKVAAALRAAAKRGAR